MKHRTTNYLSNGFAWLSLLLAVFLIFQSANLLFPSDDIRRLHVNLQYCEALANGEAPAAADTQRCDQQQMMSMLDSGVKELDRKLFFGALSLAVAAVFLVISGLVIRGERASSTTEERGDE